MSLILTVPSDLALASISNLSKLEAIMAEVSLTDSDKVTPVAGAFSVKASATLISVTTSLYVPEMALMASRLDCMSAYESVIVPLSEANMLPSINAPEAEIAVPAWKAISNSFNCY